MTTININLLPRPKRKIRQVPIILVLGISIICAGSWYLYTDYASSAKLKAETEQQLQKVKAEKEELQKTMAMLNQKGAELPDTKLYAELPNLIGKATVPADFLLEEIAALLPENSLITGLEYKAPDQLKLSGTFSTIEEVVSFIQAVDKSPVFGMAKIGSVGVGDERLSQIESMIGQKPAPYYTMSFELTIKKNTRTKGEGGKEP